jgi:hypothetical protein
LELSLKLVIVDRSRPSHTCSVVHYVLSYFMHESRVAYTGIGDGGGTIVLILARRCHISAIPAAVVVMAARLSLVWWGEGTKRKRRD